MRLKIQHSPVSDRLNSNLNSGVKFLTPNTDLDLNTKKRKFSLSDIISYTLWNLFLWKTAIFNYQIKRVNSNLSGKIYTAYSTAELTFSECYFLTSKTSEDIELSNWIKVPLIGLERFCYFLSSFILTLITFSFIFFMFYH